jgi:tRNA-Thr(GGU) m(6)t(6)A37 methyltransferase TsaA
MPHQPEISYTLNPIGIIHSCYREKFGIPRQPGLVKSATATLELSPPYNTSAALRGLEEFTHVWICFIFHQSICESWKPTVRPPRLGGNDRIGVFASRSNFRPNPIGLSVVELLDIDDTLLHLGGGDFLDQTPVLDIKPYLPYVDSVPNASGGFAATAPEASNKVVLSDEAEQAIARLEHETRPALRNLIKDMLMYNPRPAYHTDDPNRIYGTRVFDLEVKWSQSDGVIQVCEVSNQSRK